MKQSDADSLFICIPIDRRQSINRDNELFISFFQISNITPP